MVIVLIGPMGCGKTTVGRILAERLAWNFDDADDFHPAENVAKMRSGIPLDDNDRAGWLRSLRQRIDSRLAADEHLILACSALKQIYRDMLGVDQRNVISIYLKGSFDLLAQRIEQRNHPYMNKTLLTSQLAAMEEPTAGITVSIDGDPETVVKRIIEQLNLHDTSKS